MMIDQIRNAFTSTPLRCASTLDAVSADDGAQLVGA
jgi:hypothetical protein